MIAIKSLSYTYKNSKTAALSRVSFDISPGECVGVLGNNGAGKSTLVSCICKIRTPQQGTVLQNGQDLHQQKRADIARHISYVSQKNETHHTTVFDAVLLGRRPHIKRTISPEDIAICERTIASLGLSAFALRYVDELSGGEQQKVLLARAIVQQPSLLLLDEPTSNLDPKNQHESLAIVRRLAAESNVSVVMVLHDVNLALRYCDKFLFLKHGKVHHYGDASTVTARTVSDVYDVQATIAEIHGQKVLLIG